MCSDSQKKLGGDCSKHCLKKVRFGYVKLEKNPPPCPMPGLCQAYARPLPLLSYPNVKSNLHNASPSQIRVGRALARSIANLFLLSGLW